MQSFFEIFVGAHAFGALYNLPVPFWLYLYGGAAAIVLSFLIIGYFINKTEQSFSYDSISFVNFNPGLLAALKVASVFLFLLTIFLTDLNMILFWIIFVLGLTYFTAIFGNLYEFINPWKIMADRLGRLSRGLIAYPKALGYYPALFFYFLFIWLELVGGTTPFKLSLILILYTAINILGFITFGKDSWFKYGEFFSVFFRLIGKIAPIEYLSGRLYLRPPFVGLLKEKAEHFSLLLFTLFMLSSTAFDGFRETLPWVRFYWYHLPDTLSFNSFDTIGLFLSPFVFLTIYLILIGLAKVVTKSAISFKELALEFTFTLIPIALVYNLAHYFTLIFTEAPKIFGVNKIILNANIVWHSQVAFILLGHIAAVYLSHLVSLNVFPTHKKALLSQFPMLILMVAYTMIGLWILSQPITSVV